MIDMEQFLKFWLVDIVVETQKQKKFNEKIDSDNVAWPRTSLKWHLFLRLSLGFAGRFLCFGLVGKHLNF